MADREFPIVIEQEDTGAFSAYVVGLPIHAAADTPAEAEEAIRRMLAEYFLEHPTPPHRVSVPSGVQER